MKTIQYTKHQIDEDDIKAVTDVLRSGFLTGGDKVPEYEKAVASKLNCEHVVAVNSATSGLILAVEVLTTFIHKKNINVWTTPNTFVATSNAALHLTKNVDFVDISLVDYNMSMQLLEYKLSLTDPNDLPDIIIVTHFAGQCCDMKKLNELSLIYGFAVIEDAAHAIGGKYKDDYIGSCKYSDLCVFSTHATKVITTGEGGLIATKDGYLASLLKRKRNNGISMYKNEWRYDQKELGFNFKLTDIQAALGISQLKKLDKFVQKRNELTERYTKAFSDTYLSLPETNVDCYHAWHLYVVLFKDAQQRYRIYELLKDNQIVTNVHYRPVTRNSYYIESDITYQTPNADNYYERCLTLPLYPSLTFEEQDLIINLIKDHM